MEKIELTCINCPLGCSVTVEKNGDGIVSVTGNSCPRGEAYARKEVTNPTRIVTSTVKTINAKKPFVSVKTKEDIPKSKIFDVMEEINKAVINGPVSIGDVVIENVAGTGIPVIATKASE